MPQPCSLLEGLPENPIKLHVWEVCPLHYLKFAPEPYEAFTQNACFD